MTEFNYFWPNLTKFDTEKIWHRANLTKINEVGQNLEFSKIWQSSTRFDKISSGLQNLTKFDTDEIWQWANLTKIKKVGQNLEFNKIWQSLTKHKKDKIWRKITKFYKVWQNLMEFYKIWPGLGKIKSDKILQNEKDIVWESSKISTKSRIFWKNLKKSDKVWNTLKMIDNKFVIFIRFS